MCTFYLCVILDDSHLTTVSYYIDYTELHQYLRMGDIFL